MQFTNGAEIDTRPIEQKLKDFNFREIVTAANAVNWVEKPKELWRRFPDQDQDGSGSCVAQSIKRSAGILLWLKEGVYVPFSASDIYQMRPNKPLPGMNGVGAFEFWRNNGITLEALVPSQWMSDAQMDAETIEKYKREVGMIFKISGHVGISSGDFETVASVIQTTGKGVVVFFYFNSQEWSQEIPAVIDTSLQLENGLRHSVVAVDYFLFNGKKYLLIEDSAHFGGFTYHLISEEFFTARNWFARYPMSFNFDGAQLVKPQYHFDAPFEMGETLPSIVALQDILKYEGLFPVNIQSTGYYGAITAKAVLQWQLNHQVSTLDELNQLAGRRVGEKTISKLNEIYG